MKLLKDFEHFYQGFSPGYDGKCRIRIFTHDKKLKTVGICSALEENTGTSTTNCIEHIYLDIKNQLLAQKSDASLSNSEVLNKLEQFIKEHKTSKIWAIAANFLLIAWRQFKIHNENKFDGDLIWIDHWPVGMGLKPSQHEFAIVRFSENFEPFWNHISEAQFEQYTGIKIWQLEPLRLESEMV
ncbi:MAG TPA: hypothetical protein DHV36_06085 [Desulfobacteraceae bacterium]|nr:hypothetical protein [Desulfobacteraceae bacterium]